MKINSNNPIRELGEVEMKGEHLAIFIPSLAGGGAERVTINLIEGFLGHGFKIDLVLSAAEGPLLKSVPPQARIVNLRSSRTIKSVNALRKYLKSKQPAYLLSALDHANIVALLARKLARVDTKVIVTVHNTLSASLEAFNSTKAFLMPRLIRNLYPLADHVVAVSKGVAQDLADTTGLSVSGIKVVYNPIITPALFEKLKQPVNHKWFSSPGYRVILAVGRLEKQKDFPTLLKAFAVLRESRKVKLIILGEGAERKNLESMVDSLGLNEDVSLPGFVENPYAYMACSSLFVLSSRWEGLPTVLVEAMAVGTPVVATDCPSGPNEILEGGRYGPLVPVGDAILLAKAMDSTLANPLPGSILRERASRFSLERSVTDYMRLLHELA